jgi:hypothetical protein
LSLVGRRKELLFAIAKTIKTTYKKQSFFINTENLVLPDLKFLYVASAKCVWSPIRFQI